MSKGTSLGEDVAVAMAKAFPGTEKHEIKSKSDSPLPPNWVRLVSISLVTLDHLWSQMSILCRLTSIPTRNQSQEVSHFWILVM